MKFIFTLLSLFGFNSVATAQDNWIVSTAIFNDKPMIYKFIDKLPSQLIRKNFPWLSIISWKYDGSKNNGMPDNNINKKMIQFEDLLDNMRNSNTIYMEVYTVTGNNLKEFAFYIKNRESFMKIFNETLSNHPLLPIEINFYEDKKWSDFSDLLNASKNK